MAIKSYQTQLEEVQAAISKIVTGMQSYTVGEREVAFARLDTLGQMETRLLIKVNRKSGKIRVRGVAIVD